MAKDTIVILNDAIPILLVLATTILIILVTSLYFTGESRTSVQSIIFAIMMAVSISSLRNATDQTLLDAFFEAYKSQSSEVQLALASLAVTFTYFGGAFFLTTAAGGNATSVEAEANLQNATPASSDTAVTFKMPTQKSLRKNDKDFFLECLEKLTVEIVSDLEPVYELDQEGVEWVDQMIRYTVAGGKMNRGLALMAVQKEFAAAAGRPLSDKERMQSAALGWCVEFLQAFFLVADDLMDSSETRRGQPCWYQREEVQLIAINDSFILESCVFKILKRYFGAEPFYLQLLDLFIEVTRQTEVGQLLDLTSQRQDGVVDLTRFTEQRYKSIVKYKTAFYSFYLPVALGMICSGITEKALFDQAREILCVMGEYFQVQDDFLDCFGDPEVIGKVGTDIQDNKCGWLVIQALARVNAKQRKLLETNYGQHDMKKVAKVKKLYKDLDLASVFAEYEEKSYKELTSLIDEVKTMPRGVFDFLLKKIYKRKV